MRNRIVPLHGVHNFRDCGAYAARDGAQIKAGLLWRSGQHTDATPGDLDAIQELGLKTVIDFRSDTERHHSPCRRHPDFGGQVLTAPTFEARPRQAPHVEAARDVQSAGETHAKMVNFYSLMPFRDTIIGATKLYLSAVTENVGPSLIHCMAGKDRTGFAVALLHSLLGVHPDDLMADYLLTNTAGNIERRIESGIATIRKTHGRDMSVEEARVLMSVHSDYLESAFAAIKERYGSINVYAEKLLDVTAYDIVKLERAVFV
jgi:protein-tyrosine phosphatase